MCLILCETCIIADGTKKIPPTLRKLSSQSEPRYNYFSFFLPLPLNELDPCTRGDKGYKGIKSKYS